MRIIDRVASALQDVFGECAEAAGRTSGVIRRKRKFDAISLAKTFVLGFLQKPSASDEELAQMAAIGSRCHSAGHRPTPRSTDGEFSGRAVSPHRSLGRGLEEVASADSRKVYERHADG